MEFVRRVFVEKRPGFDVEAGHLLHDLRENLGMHALQRVRICKRYDLSGLTDEEYAAARDCVLSEPNCDFVYEETLPPSDGACFAIEFLAGQYDQRADSAAQCVQLLTQKERPLLRCASVYILEGPLSDAELKAVKDYLINPIECQEAALDKPASLVMRAEVPADVPIMAGFIHKSAAEIASMVKELGLAMNREDLAFCQGYFRDEEQRDPSYAELRVIDTYWSDHCRHTTFHTAIDEVEIDLGELSKPIIQSYLQYQHIRLDHGRQDKAVSLMDLATIGMRELKKQGKLDNLDASEEINACSIVITADIDGQDEEWLLMFKNETHNHPTEIEPYGGAATCLGGAIRDPLSGRAYAYQAMRITGAADPRASLEDTLPGKLSQRKITTSAAAGFSTYGNQIGLAAGKVQEIYHPGYLAKRMELGAIMAAAPRSNVVREVPAPGDVILLIGGRTGRDGCGGATGSSKAHTGESLQQCAAEVQKGNPLCERNIQRLFRNADFSRRVKRCNDFGAGGVCVAIGELASGLDVDLDKVPKKYEGLDGTELAISESQERMACVFAPADVAAAIALAASENLEATPVAVVTDTARLRMQWRGKTIIDLARSFLDSNGVTQHASAHITAPDAQANFFQQAQASAKAAPSLNDAWLATLRDLNVCSQKGLIEHFDSSVGAATIISPLGGRLRLTPNEAMAAKLPVSGRTTTCSLMSHGFNPLLSEWSPYHGALYAVIEANAKIAAAGGDVTQVRMSFQEYFERLGEDEVRWGKPLAALLGGLKGQLEFGTASIGGKDSMSGSFEDISVPPTLVAFAVTAAKAGALCSPELKHPGSRLFLLSAPRDAQEMPDFAQLRENFAQLQRWIGCERIVVAAHSVGQGGIAAALAKMCFGNWLGATLDDGWDAGNLFAPDYGAIIIETAPGWTESLPGTQALGWTSAEPVIRAANSSLSLEEALAAWQEPLEKIFPTRAQFVPPAPPWQPYSKGPRRPKGGKVAKPRVFIPVFPGTNCEYDTQRAFERAGATVERVVLRNRSSAEIEESIQAIVKAIANAQIIAFAGGFSGGDEPDGSGKFIATTFRNPRVAAATESLLGDRDGLILGICNGFQALIKLGLVPYGEIRPRLANEHPALAFNSIARHAASSVRTVVASNLSPWLMHCQIGDVHEMPISHGEGRFVANEEQVQQLLDNGQIAFQYADLEGKPVAAMPWNPNGSIAAVEGLCSPDGRVLGKMGHSERGVDTHIAINIPGQRGQGLFQAGVDYFA
jgi:phosphoribosylformylglycinamidine synthase